MNKTIESLLLNVMELATGALAPGAPVELKRQAGAALRGIATMIDGGAAEPATAAAAPPAAAAAAPSSSPPSSSGSSSTPPPAEPPRPDFMTVLMSKLAPMLPDGALSEAAEAARAEGFRMPMGIDLDKFVQAQARVRA